MTHIFKYSEKSFVVTGENTKSMKEQLKAMRGKYNRFLTHPVSGEKFGGWIFSLKHLDEVSSTVQDLDPNTQLDC